MWFDFPQFRFASPWMLVLLAPVALFSLRHLRRPRPAILYSSSQIVADLPRTLRQSLSWLTTFLVFLGLGCLIFAMARPQRADEKTRIRTEGIAIQMCIDRSGSMQALDFPVDGESVDRLTAVKKVFREFVAGSDEFSGRPNDLIGLIAFGGFATALCPPTLDHDAVLTVLESVEIPQPIRDADGRILNEQLLQEERATAIGDALALATERIRGIDATSRIIVLLSDGENTAGIIEPSDAVAAAEEFGIKVYTIGIGSDGMAPFPAVDVFGRRVLQMQAVRVDEKTLKEIAERTGGRYFNATNTDALAQVYAEIDQLERTEIEGTVYRNYEELYWWFATFGAGSLIVGLMLSETWLRTLP